MDKKLKNVFDTHRNTVLFIIILFSLTLRYGVSLNSYSGAATPPMFGDYEAQRHWMEITYNLPVKQWYKQSEENDLLYWGLDYPPLTAYHSYINGYLSKLLNPKWVALNDSRGFESYEHKLFMRSSVFLVDVLFYIPAMILFFQTVMCRKSSEKQLGVIVTMLSYPGLILVDHGHFQYHPFPVERHSYYLPLYIHGFPVLIPYMAFYRRGWYLKTLKAKFRYNCVSLGFAVLAVFFLLKRNHVFGSVFFVFALNYKQMELYHALPFFFYLLGVCIKQKSWADSFLKLCMIGGTVLISFAIWNKELHKTLTSKISWYPFLSSMDDILAVVQRLFPFNRGLFEDKVANFWCSLSVVVKLKNIFDQQQMVYLCLFTTVVSCLPSSIDLLIHPTKKKFLYSLINCSLSFFLFSYQVHEKSILIVAVPVCLVILDTPFVSTWFLMVSTISMYPLLVRDGQSIAYFALLVIFFIMCWIVLKLNTVNIKQKIMLSLSLLSAVTLHVALAVVPSPVKYPDLYPLLFAVYSCIHFLVMWLYYNYRQFICETHDVPAADLFEIDRKKIN